METATEKVVRLLLLYPKRRWRQKELALRAACSKAFLSKLTKKFAAGGMVVKAGRDVVLINPTKLITYWCSIRKLPKPVYIQTAASKDTILEKVKGRKDICLTLFSSAWLRVQLMKTSTVELYVLQSGLSSVAKKLGQKSKMPTNVVLFPTDKDIFEGAKTIQGIAAVSPVQNYVDLMVYGGSGSRVATKLAEQYKLLG
ncbi:MAG: hypothetical protein HYY37_04020 [Candidatus Aenigmarchaeota archaeon]|nr:hypothetical protein [Candidatus Aenigmarchaeota archaeon]